MVGNVEVAIMAPQNLRAESIRLIDSALGSLHRELEVTVLRLGSLVHYAHYGRVGAPARAPPPLSLLAGAGAAIVVADEEDTDGDEMDRDPTSAPNPRSPKDEPLSIRRLSIWRRIGVRSFPATTRAGTFGVPPPPPQVGVP